MKINRDYDIVYYIEKHYKDILHEISFVNGYEGFCRNEVYQKAIILDLIQIGENINSLDFEFKEKLSKRDLKGIISFRNLLVHGYAHKDTQIIWKIIEIDLPRLINQIYDIAFEKYVESINNTIGKTIEVIIDKHIDSKKYINFNEESEINCGFFEGIVAPNYEFQNVYILGLSRDINKIKGVVVAIIRISFNNKYILVVSESFNNFSKEELLEKLKLCDKSCDLEIIY